MMIMGDERMHRFIRTVERMQACELNDMDYRVSRMTDDYGIVTYEMEIPDKDITSLLRRPSILRLERNTTPVVQPDGETKAWTSLIRKMRERGIQGE